VPIVRFSKNSTTTLVLAALVAALSLAGCSSLPLPKSADSSLLVLVSDRSGASGLVSDIVVIGGPTLVTIDLTRARNGVSFVRVLPGSYRIVSRTLRWRDGSHQALTKFDQEPLRIEGGTIVLPRWKFGVPRKGDTQSTGAILPTGPADRRIAASQLKDYVQIAEWAGRQVSGFSPYSPFSNYSASEYTVKIQSEPAGAQLSVDGQDWGDTPLPVTLTAGKHFVRLTHPGYQTHSAFINVGADGTESFSLEKASETKANGTKSSVTVMIQPFVNLSSSSYDNLAGVFTDSLKVALTRAGVDIVKGGTQESSDTKPAKASPDFAAAEREGAQAFIAGDYSADPSAILVHAALYDTRTHLVKASVLFNGEGGVNIFDSIDEMSGKLGAAVEKVLPEVGQMVVQERVITPEAVVFNSRVNEEEIIHKRNEKKYVISFGPSLVGVMDSVTDPLDPTNSNPRMNGPNLGLYAGADLPISGPLALHLATMPIPFTDFNSNTKVELPLYVGARYNFYGFMSDVYLGLQGALHFAPASAVELGGGNNSGPSVVTVGPFWLAGLNFEAGVRIYTYQRTSALPDFIGFGLTLGFFGYRYDLNFSNPVSYPMELGIRVYWGTRL